MNLLGAKTNRINLPFNLGKAKIGPGMVFGAIILTALLAFEMFNYSTTDYALRDLLGELRFAGIRWATILTMAFCCIDFAGIARLFTPGQGGEEPKEVWYLFGAWMLAATMNAMLTWWGVSMAIVNHAVQSTAVIPAATLTRAVPVFVALMVWVIRILIIGSLSVAGNRMAGVQQPRRAMAGTNAAAASSTGVLRPSGYSAAGANRASASVNAAGAGTAARGSLSLRPANRTDGGASPLPSRGEPTYHSLSGDGKASSNNYSAPAQKF